MTPAHRYYGALLGAWSGPYRVELTNAAALPVQARLALTVLARLPAPRFSTTLLHDGGRFAHTTRVTSLGLPLLASREAIVPGGDGRSVRLEGVMGSLVLRPYTAVGEVDEDAAGASYRIPWSALVLEQRLTVTSEGLALEHRTPGSVARALLQRV